MPSFIKIDTTKLSRNGTPIRLRGVNLGNWMLIEHFMIGLPWTDRRIRDGFREVLGNSASRAFFDAYMSSYVTDDDFAFIKATGLNFVRLPFSYGRFESDQAPGSYRAEGFALVDRVIELCRRHDMYVLLDLHSAPGAQARDWNSESDFGESLFWRMSRLRERVVSLWRHIAGSLCRRPGAPYAGPLMRGAPYETIPDLSSCPTAGRGRM